MGGDRKGNSTLSYLNIEIIRHTTVSNAMDIF
jgi:hypothetical protein